MRIWLTKSLIVFSHVNYSVTKIPYAESKNRNLFYSHVNYSVTKIIKTIQLIIERFYSHVNSSVTKIRADGTL